MKTFKEYFNQTEANSLLRGAVLKLYQDAYGIESIDIAPTVLKTGNDGYKMTFKMKNGEVMENTVRRTKEELENLITKWINSPVGEKGKALGVEPSIKWVDIPGKEEALRTAKANQDVMKKEYNQEQYIRRRFIETTKKMSELEYRKKQGLPVDENEFKTAKEKMDKAVSIYNDFYKPKLSPKDGGGVINNLNPTGSVFTDYNPSQRAELPLGKNITTLDKTMGKSADEIITIYRGGGDIVAGDFITTNKQLAKDYAGNGKVYEKKVKLSDILDDKTEPLGEEYIYRPKKLPEPVPEVAPVAEAKMKTFKKYFEDGIDEELLSMGRLSREAKDRIRDIVDIIVVEPKLKFLIDDDIKRLLKIQGYRDEVFTPNADLKSQLTDIWNKAQAKPAAPVEASLTKEAKKYKSAEEFVKAQGTPVYHGTNYANARQIQQNGLNPENATSIKGDKKFIFLTRDEQYAKSYATQKGGDNSFVLSVKKPSDASIEKSTYKKGMKFPDLVSQKTIPPEDIIIKGKDGKWYPIKEFNFFAGEVDTYIGKTPVEIKTKSQLTDIWNNVHRNNI